MQTGVMSPSFQRRIVSLPSELRTLILTWLLRLFLKPGKIYVGGEGEKSEAFYILNNIFTDQHEAPPSPIGLQAMDILLQLGPDYLRIGQKILYEENTFALPDMHYDPATIYPIPYYDPATNYPILRRIPLYHVRNIRALELVFPEFENHKCDCDYWTRRPEEMPEFNSLEDNWLPEGTDAIDSLIRTKLFVLTELHALCSLTVNVMGIAGWYCDADQYMAFEVALDRMWGTQFPLHHFTFVEPGPTIQGFNLSRAIQLRCSTATKGCSHCGGAAMEQIWCVEDYARKFTFVRQEHEMNVGTFEGLNWDGSDASGDGM